jgi:hypothetical protein
MLDSTRDLVLNYELYYANNMAATNTIISGVVNILRVTENTEWICTNIFRNLEVNFNGLYHDLASLYRDVTINHSIISRQISQSFIVLNRMYKGFKQTINETGKSIIERIFESITITYQQFNQDMIANTGNILSIFNNQFNELSNTITSNLNIIKINFQTMDTNDRLILLSNSEIKKDIRIQTAILNLITESFNSIPNAIIFILSETIAAFVKEQRNENDIILWKLEAALMQGFNAIIWEIKDQRKEFEELPNRFDDSNETGKNHPEIMMLEFKGVKESEQEIINHLTHMNQNNQSNHTELMDAMKNNYNILLQTM